MREEIQEMQETNQEIIDMEFDEDLNLRVMKRIEEANKTFEYEPPHYPISHKPRKWKKHTSRKMRKAMHENRKFPPLWRLTWDQLVSGANKYNKKSNYEELKDFQRYMEEESDWDSLNDRYESC